MRALAACLLAAALATSAALAANRSGGVTATLSNHVNGTYTLLVKNDPSAAGYVLSFTYIPVSVLRIAKGQFCAVKNNKVTCSGLFMSPGASDSVLLTIASGSPGSGGTAGTIVANLQGGGTTTTSVANLAGSGTTSTATTTTTTKTPPAGKYFRCSVYLAGGAGMVTFSTHVIPSAADVGPGVPAFDCAGEATILTSHNVGRSQVSHNRWTTQPQTAHRTLVCLFHQVYFGSVLTISVRDSSETIVSGDACTYLVVHGAR